VAKRVDVVEPMAKFTAVLQGKAGVRDIFNVGLEEWQPAEGVQYDLVWNQWCVGHLTDEQLVQYLERCKAVLRPESGVIVIKENLSTSGADTFDDLDSSVTR
jgi:protein N-terminal methyltransferase